jgi:hypothetical protein
MNSVKIVQKVKDVNVTKIVIKSMMLVSSTIIIANGYKIWDVAL